MHISVFGLGYVGSVTAATLARNGHQIVGVDNNPGKVQMMNAGLAPVIEPGLNELLENAVARGRLRATTNSLAAVAETEMSIVCVGTPSQKNGKVSTHAVREVSAEIGQALCGKRPGHVVVLRSTVPPGSTRNLVRPTLEEFSGGRVGVEFGLAHNPEFLREGTAIADFDNPPKTVIGAFDELAASKTAELYAGLDAPLVCTTVETSELVKYVDNVWHALKVCFGNEVGNICKAIGIDSHKVMDIFCHDTKLNISPTYLRPGFAFGGSCLPKDTAALTYLAKELDLELPIISSILPSNRIQIGRAIDAIAAKGKRRVAMLGLSFKSDSDDLRESPLVRLAEQLIGKGYDIRVYDQSVRLAVLTGANKAYIDSVIPHIHQLMVSSLDEALAHAEVVVLGQKTQETASVPERLAAHQLLVDLVRVGGVAHLGERYDGINW
jgi:GDP-mannose 6-dehydrogenase